MTTPDKSEGPSTLTFRVDPDVPEMLKKLAKEAGVSMTEYATILIRAMYRERFPGGAEDALTPAERLERQLLGNRQDRYRGEIDAAFERSEEPGTPVHVALRRNLRMRPIFDGAVGSGRTIAVEAEWSALRALRHFQQEPGRRTEEAAARAIEALTGFYEFQIKVATKGGK